MASVPQTAPPNNPAFHATFHDLAGVITLHQGRALFLKPESGAVVRKRNRFMCYYFVAERCSFLSGNSKEGTRWDTSHKPH